MPRLEWADPTTLHPTGLIALSSEHAPIEVGPGFGEYCIVTSHPREDASHANRRNGRARHRHQSR
ncbi:MAG: hypothetical protein V3R98_13515, partial [Alphaproteobacteria bacterium]